MGSKMTACPWEEIKEFDGWSEFERFLAWIDQQVMTGQAQEVDVLEPYNVMNLTEKWFEHIPSGTIWRLVWPAPPFAGVFNRADLPVSTPK